MSTIWKTYNSGDIGMATLSGTAGDFTTLLDQILVNGGTAQAITSITRSGATATVTSTGVHGITVGATAILTIAGAVQTDYNLTQVTVTATSTTAFTYTVANSPTTPATGTITWKHSAAGWSIAQTAANKRIYYMGAGALSRRYYRIDDSAAGTGGAKDALIKGYVTVSDVNTGTGAFPTTIQSALTANSLVIRKSVAASATTRSWTIQADDRTCVVYIATGDTAGIYTPSYFGEFYSFIPTDTTCNILSAQSSENAVPSAVSNAGAVGSVSSTTAGAMIGTYTCGDNSGFNISSTVCSAVFGGAAGQLLNTGGAGVISSGVMAYPNLGDGGLYLFQPTLYRPYAGGGGTISAIGRFRGVWFQGHAVASFTDGDTFTGAGEQAGKSFLVRKYMLATGSATTSALVLETTSPANSA